MKYLQFVLVLLFTSFAFTQETKPFSIGEIVELDSKILKEKRILNIYLPHGYHKDSVKIYNVIYLLDGSVDEDFIHIAGLVQFVNFPWAQTMPESIVVGIANVDRKRDFTYPTNNKKDKKDFPTTGGSANFIEFLEKELQPYISKNYRVNSTKTLIGQSLGGLLATEILFKKPELFSKYIIVSPSLWWDDESLFMLNPKFNKVTPVYLAIGKEGKIMEGVANKLADFLKKDNSGNLQLYFDYLKDQNHANMLHIAVYNAIHKLFKKEEKK